MVTQGARVERCVELAAECAGCRQHNLAITGLSAAVIQLAARIGTNYLARESAFCSIAVMRRAWSYAIDSQEDAAAAVRVRVLAAFRSYRSQHTSENANRGEVVSRTSSKGSRMAVRDSALNSGPVLTRAALRIALDSVS